MPIASPAKSPFGANFIATSITKNGREVKLALWDTAGQKNIDQWFLCIIVELETFESFRGWCDDLFRAEPDVVCIIVGNKCDSAQERLVSAEEGQQMTHDIGALYTEASAKTGEKSFGKLFDSINFEEPENHSETKVDLKVQENNNGGVVKMNSSTQYHITTANQSLDDVLCGGIPLGSLTQVVGFPGCGKTELCMQLACTVQLPIEVGGVGGDCVYFDSGYNFSAQRIREIAENFCSSYEMENVAVEKVLSRIHIIKPTNLFELSALILSLSDKKWNIKLIVIDSLASLHKNTTFLKDNGVLVNCMTSLMNNILSYATTYNVAVVAVNHLTNKKVSTNYINTTISESAPQRTFFCRGLGVPFSSKCHTSLFLFSNKNKEKQIVIQSTGLLKPEKVGFGIDKEGTMFFVLLLTTVFAVDYNINIRFESNAENQIIDFVNEITSLSDIENYINFTKCAPHVTLYLTSFPEDKIDEISVVVAQTLREMRGCHIHPTTMYVSGSYFMWTVEKNECLQLLSDTIVNATAQYRNTSYECPGWVYGLPDGESKERKIKYCELYSSPNVFEEFDPHITLVYNDKDDMAVLETYSPLSLNEESIRISNAPTGNYGTVPRNTEVHF
ncbi:DNA repair and recombination protein RadA [Entamoeba marina]